MLEVRWLRPGFDGDPDADGVGGLELRCRFDRLLPLLILSLNLPSDRLEELTSDRPPELDSLAIGIPEELDRLPAPIWERFGTGSRLGDPFNGKPFGMNPSCSNCGVPAFDELAEG
jgi:hypothetical protein